MPITVKLSGTEHSIYTQTAERVLFEGAQKAIEKLSEWEKFVDMFRPIYGAKTNLQIITEIEEHLSTHGASELTSGADIVLRLAKFSELKDSKGETTDFLRNLRLEVGESKVVFTLNDLDPKHRMERSIEGPFVLPDQLVQWNSKTRCQLKEDVVQGNQLANHAKFLSLFKADKRDEVIKILNYLPKATTSKDFQGGILKLEEYVAAGKKTEFNEQLRLEVIKEKETSIVKVFLNDEADSPLVKVGFGGEFKPHDRLFDHCKNSDSAYQLKADTAKTRAIRELYIKSLDINAIVKADPLSKITIGDVHQPLGEGVIEQCWRDTLGTEELLPANNEVNDVEVLTKENFRTVVQAHFNPDIEERSPAFKELYTTYAKLGSKNQLLIYEALAGDENKKEAKEEEIALNMGLVEVREAFTQLQPYEKDPMIKCFSFLRVNTVEIDDFKKGLPTLPIKEKLELASRHQGFRNLAALLPSLVLADSRGISVFESRNPLYYFKTSKVDEKKLNAEVKLDHNVNFIYGTEESDVVALGEVKMEYSLTLPEDKNLAGVTHQFDEKKLNYGLVVLNQDGSIPQDCENVFIDDVSVERSMMNNNFTLQFQRSKIEAQVIDSSSYLTTGYSLPSYVMI